MSTERSLAWGGAQVLARIVATLLLDLKVEGLENIPSTIDRTLRKMYQALRTRR